MPHKVLITGANGFIGSHAAVYWKPTVITSCPSTSCRARRIFRCWASRHPATHERHRRGGVSRALRQGKTVRIFSMRRTLRATKSPSVIDYCYHAMTNIFEAAKAT